MSIILLQHKLKDTSTNNSEKKGLHPRNKHTNRYDFDVLISDLPSLKDFVSLNKFNDQSIDFANPEAVKTLNKALLKHFYGIENWDIPANYLCPPIPGRADYIHYIADILGSCNDGIIPLGEQITILDIGIGANCVYPIIGHQEYGWNFVGSDVDPVSIKSAEKIIESNSVLSGIEIRLQSSKRNIFKNLITSKDFFDFTLCNPPFHSSQEEATKGTERKLRNLGKPQRLVLNFGGKNNELWCEGGEISFITNMIYESVHFKSQCFWFSTLVSKKENLKSIYRLLKKVNPSEIKTIEMQQGNKISRIVAWTFLDEKEQSDWKANRWNK